MSRINITSTDEVGGEKLYWFDPDKATRFDQGTYWDGSNRCGAITRSQWIDEYLYLTAGGRWVLNRDATRHHGGPDVYRFITDEQARAWLIKSEENDAAVRHYFGEIEEERGPGRPAIGGKALIAFGDDLLLWIDARAVKYGMTRAALLREILEQARRAE